MGEEFYSAKSLITRAVARALADVVTNTAVARFTIVMPGSGAVVQTFLRPFGFVRINPRSTKFRMSAEIPNVHGAA